MAIMIPDTPPSSGPGHQAERQLYEALRDRLEDDFFVYHGLRFIEPQRAVEGEVDFLILHRTKGMLVLECKGHGVKLDGRGRWVRVQHDGSEEELKRGPFVQAQEQVKQLVAQLRPRVEQTFPHLPRFPLAYGHAVAFPFTRLSGDQTPLHVPREILYDADDLDFIGDKVRATMSFWRRTSQKPPPFMEPHEFKKFRRHLLQPALHLVPSLGAALRAEARDLHRLTEEQLEVVDSWLDNKRLRVTGGAGTGKTVLAVEATRALALEGKQVLLLCFNRALGLHLSATLEGLGLDPARARASNFHRLCAHASYQVDGGAPQIPDGKEEAQLFWEEEAPLILLRALEANKLEHCDAVVVDEGQDFAPGWWVAIDELLREREAGRLIVFYDPAQEIFGRGACMPELPTFKLTHNLRNTRRIAEVVQRLGQVETRPWARSPEGQEPVLHPHEGKARTRRQLDTLVRGLLQKEKLLPEQIVVLTPHSRPNSSLADVEELGGVPLMDKHHERPGAVLHTTIGAFKGLEADVVIMADIDPADERCSRNARYVAASRARHLLHVYSKGDWLPG